MNGTSSELPAVVSTPEQPPPSLKPEKPADQERTLSWLKQIGEKTLEKFNNLIRRSPRSGLEVEADMQTDDPANTAVEINQVPGGEGRLSKKTAGVLASFAEASQM